MPERAQVSSIEAIEAFRANLIVYLGKARPALEEVSAEVLRTRLWLESDQQTHWQNELRRHKRDLDEAQQALFSTRLSQLREESAAEVQAVHRAKRAFEDAADKLKLLKYWNRDFESRVQPLVKQMEKMHTVLTNDLPQAIAYLGELVKTLDAYTDSPPPTQVEGAAVKLDKPAAQPPAGQELK